MALKLSNNATSTLLADISTSDTTLSVQSAHAARFPSLGADDWFPLAVVDNAGNLEFMRATARVGSVISVVRARESTTAKSFAAGARVDARLTVAALLAIQNMSDLPDLATTLQNLGLEEVDNTRDADKPVSAAAQTALDTLSAAIAAVGADVDAVEAALLARLPVGTPLSWPMPDPPAGFLERDGALLSRTTFAALWAVLHRDAAVTVSIASPGQVSWASHGLKAGDKVRLYTTGALPTGLSVNTDYFVLAAGFSAGSFRLGATDGGAAIATSGSQSGVQTCRYAPHGHGDGSATFALPDDRGAFERGWDHGRGTADAGRVFASEQRHGIESHAHGLVMDAVLDHQHLLVAAGSRHGLNDSNPGSNFYASNGDSSGSQGTPQKLTNAAGAHTPTGAVAATGGAETRVRNRAYLPIIKY